MIPMDKEVEEGWYTDPFGRHEARWLSNGHATKLVRARGPNRTTSRPMRHPSRTR
jgi:hypothetical protein